MTAHPGRYPLDVKAQALALLREGYGIERVSDRLHELMGVRPDPSTVWDWREAAKLSQEIRAQSEELAIRYGRILHKQADILESLPDEQLVKHIIPANAVRGTNQDKLTIGPQSGTQVNIVLAIATRPEERSQEHSEMESRTGTEIELDGTVLQTKDSD